MKEIPRYVINWNDTYLESDKGNIVKFEDFERYSDKLRMENMKLKDKSAKASKMICDLKIELRRVKEELRRLEELNFLTKC